ncbi:MAG: acetyl-CoA carboxylase biotin carboxyl carrier protein subunit [Desulfobacca sp.]|nr:acetyl-CoA carboxylase biotin carboxyl carrier protein subunit [Desulfobacca sp.]
MSELEINSHLIEVRAPMSGVFYQKPAPDQPAYIEEGDIVKKKQVLGLLETMKVFQKIKAPVDGRVLRVVAENETALKDDELIMIIEKV